MVVLLLVLGAHLTLRSGLRPLQAVADTARDTTRGRRDRRVPVGGPRTELGAVAVALNDAFDARDRTEQLVRTFVSDASHELRTPLSGIHGWADLYLSGGLDDWDGVDAAMRRIRDETTRMSVLVEQMLVRHTPTGTDVWIHAWHEEGEVVLRVRDSGPGLGDTARAHAFDRFWRADMSRSTSGSGLGLAIVGDTVRAHRGSVQLHDAPGGGLDVVVRLPAAPNRAGPRAGRRARAPWPVR